MQKLTFGQRLTAAFIEPRQVVLLNSSSGNPARNLMIRPISIILILLGLPAIALFAGYHYAPMEGARNIIPQHMQLQRQHRALQKKYSDSQAMNELKERQIESLENELAQQQEHAAGITQRLLMWESILEGKKYSGIQLLKFNANWASASLINYHFTLVRGGNYRRRSTGTIIITTQDPEGNKITLNLDKSQSELPYRMKSHTFLDGHIIWNKPWKPNKLLATIYNKKGKEIIQKEIVIAGESL